jgi:hypothetical protein
MTNSYASPKDCAGFEVPEEQGSRAPAFRHRFGGRMRKGSRSGCWHCRCHAPAAHTPLRSRRCNFTAVRTNSEHGPRGRNETARHASTHARHRRSLPPYAPRCARQSQSADQSCSAQTRVPFLHRLPALGFGV